MQNNIKKYIFYFIEIINNENTNNYNKGQI